MSPKVPSEFQPSHKECLEGLRILKPAEFSFLIKLIGPDETDVGLDSSMYHRLLQASLQSGGSP